MKKAVSKDTSMNGDFLSLLFLVIFGSIVAGGMSYVLIYQASKTAAIITASILVIANFVTPAVMMKKEDSDNASVKSKRSDYLYKPGERIL